MNQSGKPVLKSNDRMGLYEPEFTKPSNFETLVLQIQNDYLELRKKVQGPPIPFSGRIKILDALARNILISKSNTLDYNLLSWAALNLIELYLLFKDNNIIEIFLNEINSQIIVHHKLKGRLLSNLLFSQEFWQSLRIQSELNSNQIISRLNPSLKTGLITPFGNLRITIQIPPLSVNPTAVIRRLPISPISSEILVNQKQISNGKLNFLLEALNNQKNIIIAGEPGSGKTTLANALLLNSNKFWRLIILEDASEVILDKTEFPLMVKYSIPSIGKVSVVNRENEISKLLHRSPDYVFLGEIQDKIDTQTMFEAFTAGIKGIATTHSYSLEGLLLRWTKNYEIQVDMVSSIDVIVITKKRWSSGRILLEVDSVLINSKQGFKEIE
ncbi:MAG: type II/IV secretion system ATPase subunit [Candidatus Heimdallarchaeota archaeon]|nr:type II/IV secretion system ATPase subunit [Candidatus Heimdallarchaeota archaeon]